MERKKVEYFRKLLNQRLQALVNDAVKTMSNMTDEEENFPDPTDRASVESDRNFLLRIRDRERKLITKIYEALDRLDKGTYGICEECGEKISEKRLIARPVTTLCIDCKTSQEEDERRRGE